MNRYLYNDAVLRGRGENRFTRNPAIFRPEIYEELVYPFEISSDESGRREFSGKNIYILNSYLPNNLGSNTGNVGALISFDQFFNPTVAGARFRVGGGFHIYHKEGFQTFYIRHPKLGQASGNPWGFAQNNALCTPLYLYVTKDLILQNVEVGQLEAIYCYGMSGTEPASVGTSTIVFFGSLRQVNRTIHILTNGQQVGTINVSITAGNSFVSVEEFNFMIPALTAYCESFEIATALPTSVSVVVTGGSASTTSAPISVIYSEKEIC